jgi:hypothetical protein
MGETITDIDIEEISSCGPPAYQRAVVKSMGFSEQISKQMGEKLKMEKNNEGNPASAPVPTQAQAENANVNPAPVASTVAPTNELNPVPAPVSAPAEPVAPVSDNKDAEANVADKPADQNTQTSDKPEEKNEVVEKAVQSGINNFVKSKDFDVIVEKSVEKILSKKSVSEPNNKFPNSDEDLNKKDIGELGASFLQN